MGAGDDVNDLNEGVVAAGSPSLMAEPNAAAGRGQAVSDPLKPLDQIFKKDRDFAGGLTIEQHHKRLAVILLHDGVPAEVRQLFETAKNIALYSHYAYRLHQPAELLGYIAFEKAMRLRAATDAPDLMAKRHISWWAIVNRAVEDRWFRYDELSGPRRIATFRAWQRNLLESLPGGDEVVEVPEPTEAEILRELESLGGIMQKLGATLALRNFLAHGSVSVSPSSVGTLERMAELINQLFRAP
jgi:hypothetical protein